MIDLPDHNHWFPAVKFYWHCVFKGIIRQLEISPQDFILDFGCERQCLKQYLPTHNIVGYDIVRDLSDVADYTVLKPHTIVCSHVLEHMEMQELLKTLDDFKHMGPKILITAQPTENWLSRICNVIGRRRSLNGNLRRIDHKLRIAEIHNVLARYYNLVSQENILTLTIISKWIPI